jgi:hypothetical protein
MNFNPHDQFNAYANMRRDEAYQALVVNALPQRKIPESVFLQNFYAFFRGEVKDKAQALAVYRNWVQIASTIFDTVSVVDQKGALVYIVPPLAASNAIKTIVKENRGLIYNEASASVNNAIKEAQTPIQKDAKVFNALSKSVTVDKNAIVEHKSDWDKLIEFFDNRLGLKSAASNPAQNNQQNKQSLHDALF